MPFVKVGKTSDVGPNKAHLFIVNNHQIAVFNVNNGFFAISNECPHKGVGLADGELDDKIITCPGHGWQFDVETGNNVILPISVKKFNTKVEGDDLYIEI